MGRAAGGFCGLVAILFVGCSTLREIVMVDDQPTAGSVQLTVDYSDGSGCKKCFGNLPWKKDMSVADVLAAAQSTGLLEVQFEEKGQIFRIDGVQPPEEPHLVCEWRIWIDMNDFRDVTPTVFPGQSILVKVVNTV
jgi:hypothetical protein